uniref:Uncharacterized protein n=1 Tax=Glossina pallidipes TaxID=7398 RepID=A0A1A9ZII8_GLOPL
MLAQQLIPYYHLSIYKMKAYSIVELTLDVLATRISCVITPLGGSTGLDGGSIWSFTTTILFEAAVVVKGSFKWHVSRGIADGDIRLVAAIMLDKSLPFVDALGTAAFVKILFKSPRPTPSIPPPVLLPPPMPTSILFMLLARLFEMALAVVVVVIADISKPNPGYCRHRSRYSHHSAMIND